MTYTADDFKNASFAKAPGKKFAARVDSTAAALQWRANDGDWYSDGDLAKHGWVPVQESRPLTPDDITDEMLHRGLSAYYGLELTTDGWDDDRAEDFRRALATALTEPPARPEGAEEIQAALIGATNSEGLELDALDASKDAYRALSDALASRGVRVTTPKEQS